MKFNNNIIRHVSEKIKELQKDKKYDEIRAIIHKIKIDNWKKFLEELVKLKVNNNVKEYFLRMKFYTDIGRNVSILNNLKINKNGKMIITKKIKKKLIMKLKINIKNYLVIKEQKIIILIQIIIII